MRIFLTVLLSVLVTIIDTPTENGCFELERDVLLTFKAGLHDPGNLMSSWKSGDCCNWSGVICDKLTRHVVKLKLRNPYLLEYSYGYTGWVSHALTGEISPTLLSLQHLTHLDLSNNEFSNQSIPKFIGSFQSLVYLNLSLSGFNGIIPCELGNLSQLRFLDLGNSEFTGLPPPQLGNLSGLQYLSLDNSYPYFPADIDSLLWLYRLSNLRYLDMSGIDLGRRVDWSAISKMHLLKTLSLSNCFLSTLPVDSSYVNLTSLTKLDLSYNSFHVLLPNWLWNLTSLLYLNLGWSDFHGSMPGALENLALLNYLSLGGNNFEHVFLEPISKLNNLRGIDLSCLGIEGDVANLIKKLSYMWYNLEDVNLWGNNISGNISSWITNMRNLTVLNLRFNSLSGEITNDIGTLRQLEELDLSYNLLTGTITEAHFQNLSNLKLLVLSGNALTMNMNDKWVPHFQLRGLYLESCTVGPGFPSWLQWQPQLYVVMLSNASITGDVPTWFWNMPFVGIIDLAENDITGNLPASFQSSNVQSLFLRSTKMDGPLPTVWGEISELDLSSNSFSGSFPKKIEIPQAQVLLLSNNSISGRIPNGICDMPYLYVLDLSDNVISGEIPNCWNNFSSLEYIDISNNQIIGHIPASIGLLQYLRTLQLDNNKLYGEIPTALQHCRELDFLSLGRNNFSGIIPAWIGTELQNLAVLQLRLNKFSGFIPSELGGLAKLQILDLSHNFLIGTIPKSLGNFSSMKNSSQHYISNINFYKDTVYTDINGQYVYTSMPLEFAKTIDMSGNNLNGQIPEEIWMLEAVFNLNLSRNYLGGEIPETIGDMRSLESLDLSLNNLSGLIPEALSSLSSLHNLNLSYNNFSGKILTGRQLDTINDPSIYVGNPYLCGPLIGKNCSEDSTPRSTNLSHGDSERKMIWFYLVIVIGFMLGYWSVWAILIFENAWKVAYFQLVDNFLVRFVYTLCFV